MSCVECWRGAIAFELWGAGPNFGAAQNGAAQAPASPTCRRTCGQPRHRRRIGTAPAADRRRRTCTQKKTYTVPAGTKVLLQLRSAVNTKSAKPGDGVYLASTFPVVVGSRVMIPAGVYVQGVVDRVARAGRVKGSAQLDMHFTSIIFPNGSVVEIPGIVNSLPGAKDRSSERTMKARSNRIRTKGAMWRVRLR